MTYHMDRLPYHHGSSLVDTVLTAEHADWSVLRGWPVPMPCLPQVCGCIRRRALPFHNTGQAAAHSSGSRLHGSDRGGFCRVVGCKPQPGADPGTQLGKGQAECPQACSHCTAGLDGQAVAVLGLLCWVGCGSAAGAHCTACAPDVLGRVCCMDGVHCTVTCVCAPAAVAGAHMRHMINGNGKQASG